LKNYRKVIKNDQEILVKDQPFWNLFDSGWEADSFDVLDHFLTKDVIYIDVGAWIGPLVLYASRKCKQAYAIEADSVAYEELCKNIEANIFQILTFKQAIYNYDGEIQLSGNAGDSMTRVGAYKTDFHVPCQTLNTFVIQNDIQNPMFIKMDIENAEEFVLEQIDFFEKYKPILFISLHPQWFKDQVKGMETIRKVGRLYRHRWNTSLAETNIEEGAGPWIFFD
jgi:FkbM family methyltransferase